MAKDEDQSQRLVRLSHAATDDLAEIHRYTSHFWGERQADRYVAFLYDAIETLAQDPRPGASIEAIPGAFVVLVRWPKSRKGHRIVYEVFATHLDVLRIVHSARDLPSVLGESE
jgi:plasmid stabilization system protein ParE